MIVTPTITRWTPARKAELLRAIETGDISRGLARVRYGITAEELASWERHFKSAGQRGLKVTCLQITRAAEAGL